MVTQHQENGGKSIEHTSKQQNRQCVFWVNIPAADRSEGAYTSEKSRTKPLSHQKDLRKGRKP
jgi:hypothetical protein